MCEQRRDPRGSEPRAEFPVISRLQQRHQGLLLLLLWIPAACQELMTTEPPRIWALLEL